MFLLCSFCKRGFGINLADDFQTKMNYSIGMNKKIIIILMNILSAAVYSEELQDEIIFGQSAVLEGAAKEVGLNVKIGIEAAFKEVNDQGGINGRKVMLKSYDDGYEPDRALTNTKKLIDEDNVFAMIGSVGTPTSFAVLPVIKKNNIPFIAPYTGAELFRNPFIENVVNLRASYFQETEKIVDRLIKDLGVKRIAVFYQNDSFGRAGLTGVGKALIKYQMSYVARGSYERNTANVEEAFKKIRIARPDAIIMIGLYKPCAAFIKLAKKHQLKSHMATISFVGTEALVKELGNLGEGVIISQVVPFPFDDNIKIVNDYHKSLAEGQERGYLSLYGYIAARFTTEILKQIPEKLTRENFIKTIYKIRKIKISDMKFEFAPYENQGLNDVYFTVIRKGGMLEAINRFDDSS
jgi:ABC-type branched-subunit amino acid transport system substrate-binding protein